MSIAGVSVDPPENNKAMVEKLILPFPLLSDPQGDLAKRCGLWNAEEGVAVPTIAVLDRGGVVRYLYVGEDFADRPGDAAVFEALDGVEAGGYEGASKEAEIRVTADEAATSSVRPDKPPMSLEQLVPYYRGVFFATVALKRRFAAWGSEGRRAFGEVSAYQRLVREYADRIKETVELKQSS